MTDKKFTDEKIIEALDLCTQQNGSIPCYDCPCWYDDEQECEGIDYTATLDLIKRQKAEIVNLKDYNEELLAEIRKLKGSTIVDNVTENQERIRREAEAYKAFAEHSKEKWWFNTTRMVGEEK